jgi:hypothetical protein
MGNIRDSKSLTAIENAIEAVITAADPAIDLTTGTAVKDIAVDAPATQMRALSVLMDFVGAIGSLQELLDILDDDTYISDLGDALPELTEAQIRAIVSAYIDNLAGNYGLTRNAATQAQYRQRFYRADANGGAPLTITVGTQVQNLDGSIKSEVQASVAQVPVLDSAKGMYYVEETVVSVTVGSGGNTALNSLVSFVAAIPSLATQTGNVSLLVAGADEENDAALVTRAKDSFRGRNINVDPGYRAIMKGDLKGAIAASPLSFTDAKVVGPGDVLMTRLATGGIDVYVIGSEPASKSEAQTYSSAQTDYLLSFQPASSIQSVVGSVSGTIAPAAYAFTADTSAFLGSARARNKMSVVTHASFSNGETITITYTYDSLILAAQNLMESDDFDVPDADLLVKLGTQVLINLTVEAVLDGSVAVATVQANIQADFATFLAGGTTTRTTVFSAFGLGKDIDKSDLLAVLAAVAGVDRIDLDTFVIVSVRAGVPTTETTDPVVLADNAYARAGTVTFV